MQQKCDALDIGDRGEYECIVSFLCKEFHWYACILAMYLKKKKFQPMKPGVFRISEFSSLDGAAVDVHDSKSSAHIVHELDGWASTGRLRVARVLCLLDLS